MHGARCGLRQQHLAIGGFDIDALIGPDDLSSGARERLMRIRHGRHGWMRCGQ
jgi:hypothetical protein